MIDDPTALHEVGLDHLAMVAAVAGVHAGRPGAKVVAATIFDNCDRLPEARDLALSAWREDHDVGAHQVLSWVLSELEEWTLLEETLHEGLADGHEVPCLRLLGSLAYDRNELDKAVHFHLRACEAGDQKAYVDLGWTYAEMNNLSAAVEVFAHAAALGDGKGSWGLGWVHAYRGEHEAAIENLIEAVTGGARGAVVTLAQEFAETGQLREAEACYRDALSLGMPEEDRIRNEHADVLAQLGRTDDAEAQRLRARTDT